MSESMYAADAEPSKWYEIASDGDRVLCCAERLFWTRESQTFPLDGDVELIHLPDCTGWDWQPPKPEKKYRPIANAAEFLSELRMRHSCDRFYRHNSETSDIHQSIGRFHDNALDGEPWDTLLAEYVWCDGTPFGVLREQKKEHEASRSGAAAEILVADVSPGTKVAVPDDRDSKIHAMLMRLGNGHVLQAMHCVPSDASVVVTRHWVVYRSSSLLSAVARGDTQEQAIIHMAERLGVDLSDLV